MANERATTGREDGAAWVGGVEPVAPGEFDALARRRLELLLEAAVDIHEAPDAPAVADVLLDAMRAGAGYARSAFVRRAADGALDVVSFRPSDRREAFDPRRSLCHSLLEAASRGEMVRVRPGQTSRPAGDDERALGVRSALCTPVVVGNQVGGYLYFDSRAGETEPGPEGVAFCEALTRLGAMALGHLEQRELRERQLRLEAELAAAREAQSLILPPGAGAFGPVRYAMHMTPGREVAGDLFDVVPLSRGRVGFFLGDVAGKGIGAGLLMALGQSLLGQVLDARDDPAAAVDALNEYLARRRISRFVSLWIGVIDPEKCELCFADAGHGHAMLLADGGDPRPIECEGGPPAGVVGETRCRSESLPFRPGDRLVLYSDGVIEQRNSGGEEFGRERLAASLGEGASAADDIAAALGALRAFSECTDQFDDDTTIASVELRLG
ncbi:MAG: SpoIIE family protein phosphatase [Myxococcota bacterium]|nr:SpoIIE family protein phosphatase [Myxococcota bacterium]